MRRASASRLTRQTQKRPHADGVAAKQVFLKGKHLVRLDALVGQLAEAGVDAVDGLTLGEQIIEAAASLFHPSACFLCESELLHLTGQDALGIGEGQVVAGQFQEGGSGCSDHALIVANCLPGLRVCSTRRLRLHSHSEKSPPAVQ